MLAPAALYTKANNNKKKKIEIKEKKLNFVLIQNGEVLVNSSLCKQNCNYSKSIERCLSIFFGRKLNDCQKNCTMQQKQEKSLYSGRQSIRN